MKVRQLASIVGAHALALLCLTGTAMAQAPLGPDAITHARNKAERIKVYRQLHGMLSHPRCIIAHAAHEQERQSCPTRFDTEHEAVIPTRIDTEFRC